MVREICSHIMYLFIVMLFAISASLFSLALRFSLPVKFTWVVVSVSLLLSHIFGASQPPIPLLQIHWDLSLSLSGTLLWSSSPPHLHLIRVAQGISFKVHQPSADSVPPVSTLQGVCNYPAFIYDFTLWCCFPMFQFCNKLHFSSKWFLLIGIKLPVEDLWTICLT